ncbi:hypothetical protein INR49_011877 [Caranx melampygus]|nr:hypothetical protein INR49_011877 [Caranx melampygus]
MAFGVFLGVALLLSVYWPANSDEIPDGVLRTACHDRNFMMAVDLSFTGEEPHFEAVDGTGVYPITERYAAGCGYIVSVLPLQGLVELRASYFSCHTDNKDDEVFTFSFNLITNQEGKEVTYTLNKSCSPSHPWAPREVTCEENYMEVSVKSEIPCPSGAKKEDWSAVKSAHSSTTSDWQVMFQRAEEQLTPITLSEAREQGYGFHLTAGRLIFRAPYGQPDSFSAEVNGVPVEVVHATLFSRQSWVVLMVDLVAACSMHEGSYDESSGYMMWETPEVLHPLVSGLHDVKVNIGVNGELVEQPVAEQRGYIVEKHNTTVHINIPYNAEGGYRKSTVIGDLSEFYIFSLYLEQILVDEDLMETRVRYHRTLATPLLHCPLVDANQTVAEEHVFTVYLGDVPEDVELTAVHLNGQEFPLPLENTSRHTITKAVHPNNTHGYTLKVPFDDPVVIQQSGISFKLDHRPFDHLWYISIGSDRLTSELAAQHGYIMSNNSQSLLLDVPLYTQGYEYKLGQENITYQNEIFYRKKYLSVSKTSSEETERIILECTYPLAGLHRLFSKYRFESDTVGIGRIIHTAQSTADPQVPTIRPTTTLQTTPATKKPTRMPTDFLPAFHPPARYIRVTRVHNPMGIKKACPN